MELQKLTNHLQDLCSQGLTHSKVILNVGGCISDLLVIQVEKKGEPVILIGAKDDELEDLSGY